MLIPRRGRHNANILKFYHSSKRIWKKIHPNFVFLRKTSYFCFVKELFDSIATQNAEIRTVANSLPPLLKYFAKSLFLNQLSLTDKNLKYKSPLREEAEASFKVNTEREQWYDFGLGKGGGIIELAAHLYATDHVPYILKRIAEQTPHVRPVSFSFGKQNSSEPSFQQLEIVPLSSTALLAYLQGRGINIKLAKRECSEARFTHNGKRYFAIAFPNGSCGYEIRNRYFKGCIAPKEISHIRQSGKARNTCYVFEGFMDYLSFLTLRQESCPNYPELDGQDYIVLNSVSNVNKALYPLGNYERIHCFFDNDHAGLEALRQIRMEYGRERYIRDASQIYRGCKDLNEYLQKQIERKRQLQSAKGVRSQSPEKKNGFQL